MKIRNGFVSNSSSSSFVLLFEKKAYDRYEKDICPHCKHGETEFYFDTNNFRNADGACGDNSFEKLTINERIKQLEKDLKEQEEYIEDCLKEDSYYYYNRIEQLKKEIEFFSNLQKDRYYYLDIQISYHDNFSKKELYSICNRFGREIRILQYGEDYEKGSDPEYAKIFEKEEKKVTSALDNSTYEDRDFPSPPGMSVWEFDRYGNGDK